LDGGIIPSRPTATAAAPILCPELGRDGDCGDCGGSSATCSKRQRPWGGPAPDLLTVRAQAWRKAGQEPFVSRALKASGFPAMGESVPGVYLTVVEGGDPATAEEKTTGGTGGVRPATGGTAGAAALSSGQGGRGHVRLRSTRSWGPSPRVGRHPAGGGRAGLRSGTQARPQSQAERDGRVHPGAPSGVVVVLGQMVVGAASGRPRCPPESEPPSDKRDDLHLFGGREELQRARTAHQSHRLALHFVGCSWMMASSSNCHLELSRAETRGYRGRPQRGRRDPNGGRIAARKPLAGLHNPWEDSERAL
jgi:hypothetical protein